ncbi:transmembrane 9 superfamily member 9-like [Rutidosis leptorrhynchoides]|uniref:transmembrane 9 superfamily member 9-like n=1 Tax=Rutidosis leptorrhynchoides TaxID=125765 RepID=UPI003A997031
MLLAELRGAAICRSQQYKQKGSNGQNLLTLFFVIPDFVCRYIISSKFELNSMADQLQLGLHFHHLSLFVFLLLFIVYAHSFYLPGVAPQDFIKGDSLKVKVNKLASTKTQLPYSYYSIPYCRPDEIVDSAENLGEVLRGDRIENSPYEFQMRVPMMCNVVCRITLSEKTANEFKEKIDDEYRVNMILDNLPLVVPVTMAEYDSQTIYQHGYYVGRQVNADTKDETYFINNHLAFVVRYHRDTQTNSARIVGFEVKAFSINHKYDDQWSDTTRLTTCDPHAKRLVTSSDHPQEVAAKNEIIFTYDVEFQESDVKWASRWDTYLLMGDDQIHWFSIVNSLMIVLFLSGMVAMIMLRTLYRDISKYNHLETQEEAQDETGWKLVHGDVFRPPVNSDLLCVYVGTGVQFLGMVLLTMVFALLGFLSPANRGGLMTALLLLWVLMGIFCGYATARLYKTFKGTERKKTTLKTVFMFPGIAFCVFFVLNTLIWGEKSSGAVPFGTMFALVVLWFGISVPLVFVGSYIGYKRPGTEDPVKTNKIPRQIPEQTWYMNPFFSIMIGGILPFGAVFIELFFILTSIWLHQFYYIFGFLFMVFIILIITCAEITIVLCYFQLCSEDYQWWWRSYLTSGSSAFYLFMYATFYFFTKLNITKLVSGILYFGYMLIASYAFFVLTGTIGFYACLWFTRLIYSSVKID